jgi:hypothetical protein
VEVAVEAQALMGQMRLGIMAVMVGQGQTLIQLGLPQQVRALVDITRVVAVVERKTLTLIMVRAV